MKPHERNHAEPGGEVRWRLRIALCALQKASHAQCIGPVGERRVWCTLASCAACIARRALARIDRRVVADVKRVHHEWMNCPRHPDPVGGVGTVSRRRA